MQVAGALDPSSYKNLKTNGITGVLILLQSIYIPIWKVNQYLLYYQFATGYNITWI